MDNSVMSALQFGIEALMIPHIVVCGHHACGGVKASASNVDHTPPLEQWVRNIRDVQRLNADVRTGVWRNLSHMDGCKRVVYSQDRVNDCAQVCPLAPGCVFYLEELRDPTTDKNLVLPCFSGAACHQG